MVLCIATARSSPFPYWLDEIQDLNTKSLLELQEQGRVLGFKRSLGITKKTWEHKNEVLEIYIKITLQFQYIF